MIRTPPSQWLQGWRDIAREGMFQGGGLARAAKRSKDSISTPAEVSQKRHKASVPVRIGVTSLNSFSEKTLSPMSPPNNLTKLTRSASGFGLVSVSG